MHTRTRSALAFWILLAAALLMTGMAGADPAAAQAADTTFDYASEAQIATLSQPDYPKIIKENTYVDVPGDGSAEQLYVEVTRPDPQEYPELGDLPVVLEASPYHGTLADREGTRIFPDPRDDEGNMIGLTGYFAQRGYAVVMVDLRGTGRSTGCLDHLGPNDAADLKTVVEWAADQEWSNGRVGMTGHSYVGSTPKVAAAQNPEGLVTIAPSAGLASMYDHQFQYGVPYLLQWAGPIFAYEQLSAERHLPGGDNFGGPPPEECAVLHSAILSDQGQATGEYDDDVVAWHANRDYRQGALDADIPVFMIHGVNDNAARIPAAEWFFGHRYERPGDKTWIGQWDHGSAANTTCSQGHPNCRFGQWQYALHAWFDKHLAQRDVDTGPALEAFLNGDVVYTDEDGWKAPDFASMYPDATDPDNLSLKLGSPPDGDGEVSFESLPVEGGSIEFTSDPVEQDTLFRGLPLQKLVASLTGDNQVFHLVTTLFNESPDGERIPMNVCAIQPSLRESPHIEGEFFKPTEGPPTSGLIQPGARMDLDPQCFTMAHHLPAGHKLVLKVGTESPHHVPNLANPFLPDEVTIYTGPDDSRYDVPWSTTFATVDDIDIPVPGVPDFELPDAPAQPPECGNVLVPAPSAGVIRADGVTVEYFEFEALPQYGNAKLEVVATPSTPADVDLFLQIKQEDGTWSEDLGATGGASGSMENETMSYLMPVPGTYRVGVVNWAGQPALDVEVCVTFFDAAGNAGVKDDEDDRDPDDPGDPKDPTEPPGTDEDPGPNGDDGGVGDDQDDRAPVLPATGGGAAALGAALLVGASALIRRRLH